MSVLYDVPGPRARRRNLVFNVVFAVVLVAVAVWVLRTLDDKGVLNRAQWEPFTRGDTWTQFVLPGLRNTLKAAGLAMVIALPIGVLFGVARLSEHRPLRWAAGAVVEFFRAIPVLLMMVFASVLFTKYSTVPLGNVPLIATVTGLVLYNGSVLAEVFRAGVLALPRGQTEAGLAVGLRKGQLMRSVLLPQATTTMLPTIVSQLVVVLKDTALGGLLLINFVELLRTADGIKNNYGNVVPSYIVIAAIYIALNFAVSQIARLLELRLRRGPRASLAGPTDQMTPTLPGGTAATGAGIGPGFGGVA
ncbi:MAG: amino acid ABC transporter permease [bacterium]